MTDTMAKDQVQQYLESEIQRKLAEAASIAEKAAGAGRGMEPDEETAGNALLADVAELKGRVSEMEKNRAFRSRLNDLSGPVEQAHEEVAEKSSMGAAFVKSDSVRAVSEKFKSGTLTGRWSSGAVELPWWGAKTNVTETLSPVVVIDTQPGIVGLPFWPTRVADLFAQGTTSSNLVRYIQELAETNAAAGTAEAALKPESAITFNNVDATVGKIATFLPVSDEMLEDVDQMQTFLDNRLAGFVRRKEDTELLNGGGAPSITGILGAGIQTGSALSLDVDSVIDALFQAITAVRVTGLYEPDGMVVNPTDWAAIRLMKDNNKQYYGGGPFTGAYGGAGGIAGDSLWGLPVVVTPAIAVGTILVGAFKTAAQIFRRRGLTVEMSNSHSDFFQRDMTAIRAETREALAVYRPSAFYSLTGANLLEGS